MQSLDICVYLYEGSSLSLVFPSICIIGLPGQNNLIILGGYNDPAPDYMFTFTLDIFNQDVAQKNIHI